MFPWGPVSWGHSSDFPLPPSCASLPACSGEAALTSECQSALGNAGFPGGDYQPGRFGFPSEA